MAAHIWQNLVRAFAGLESEKRWVDLATIALAQLHGKLPPPESKTEAIREAADRIKDLRKRGKEKEANDLLLALTELYKDEDGTLELLKSALSGRKK